MTNRTVRKIKTVFRFYMVNAFLKHLSKKGQFFGMIRLALQE
jgi:hypothetical protein